jgi:hypothetical protein
VRGESAIPDDAVERVRSQGGVGAIP